ncbi:MAG: hypothetical protein IPJ32_02650 [Sphingobacteriaceae bacterium]|jgi:hypothetical protein|nr:hypothetical protein [Sphingobacteriaceae bacterium]MBP7809808.1 hypothetical protein [Bacteroidia bacterium]
MKKIIIIGAALLVTTGAALVANNLGTTDCPICPQGTCCPVDDCCKK